MQPSWCERGHCVAAAYVADLRCCCNVEPTAHLAVHSAPLCERTDIAALIDDGVSSADVDHYSKQRIKGKDRPHSLTACNNALTRLMVYAVLHRMLYLQGSRGQRDPIPEYRTSICDDSTRTWHSRCDAVSVYRVPHINSVC